MLSAAYVVALVDVYFVYCITGIQVMDVPWIAICRPVKYKLQTRRHSNHMPSYICYIAKQNVFIVWSMYCQAFPWPAACHSVAVVRLI